MRALTRNLGALYLMLALSMQACDIQPPLPQNTQTYNRIAGSTLPPPYVSTQVTGPSKKAASDYLVVQSDSCAKGGNMREIAALDDITVIFKLCSPDAAFPAKAALPVFGIQPYRWIKVTGGTGEILENPIGTGPWRLKEWLRGQTLSFSRFEGYWREQARFNELIFRWESESDTRLAALRSGAVDVITHVNPNHYSNVRQDDSLTLIPVQNTNTLYIGINNNFAPFDDARVRQAVSIGIDREKIVSRLYPDGSEIPKHFTPCSIPNGCAGQEWPQFDPQAARALLDSAGYPQGFETALHYHDVYRISLPEPGQLVEELQQQLRQNLNIEVSIVLMDSSSFIRQAINGDLQGFHLLGWGADYAHISSFLDFHFGPESQQFGSPHPSLQQLLATASTLTNPTAAAPLYAQANNAIQTLVPAIPIAHGGSAYASKSNMSAAITAPFGVPEFYLSNPGTNRLVFMQNAEPISLYCADEIDFESMAACQQVIEGLFAYNPYSAKIEPRLAEVCTPNATASEWLCVLRQNIRFHDGSQLHANDVVASWAASLDATNPYHTGNTGNFIYPKWLWGGLMNNSPR